MAREIKYGILLWLRDQVSGGLGKVEAKFRRFGEATAAASRKARYGLLAMAGAVTAITYAAAKQEKADRALADALKSVNAYSDERFKLLKDQAAAIQELTTYGDEEIEALQAQALNLGIQADKLDDVIRGSIGLSKALNLDLNTALRYTALAMQGEYTVLQRYVPALRMAQTEGEKLAIVQDLMRRGFEQARGEAETLTGRLKQLKNTFGDLLETIGQAILGTDSWAGALDKLKAKLKAAIDWIKGLSEGQRKAIVTAAALTAGLLAVTAALSPLAFALAGVTKGIQLLGITSLAAAGKVLAIAAPFAVVAGAAALVLDAFGVLDTGIVKYMERWKPLHTFWTSLAAGMLEVYYAGRRLAAEPFGPKEQEKVEAERKAALQNLWRDYEDRRGEIARQGAGERVQINRQEIEQVKAQIEAAKAGIAGAAGAAAEPAAAPAAGAPGRQAAAAPLADPIAEAIAKAIASDEAQYRKRQLERQQALVENLRKAGYAQQAARARDEAIRLEAALDEYIEQAAATFAALAEKQNDMSKELDRQKRVLARLAVAR